MVKFDLPPSDGYMIGRCYYSNFKLQYYNAITRGVQEGDAEHPHRTPGPGKAMLLEMGAALEDQTRRGPGRALTFDPAVEDCGLDRETLMDQRMCVCVCVSVLCVCV